MKCRTLDCNELAKYDGYCHHCIGRQWIACKYDKCDQLVLPSMGDLCFYHRPAQLLSSQDAATMLGVSPKTMQRLADSGRLAYETTTGGHRRFYVDGIKKLLEERHAQT